VSTVELHELLAQVEPRLRQRYAEIMERLRQRNDLARVQRYIDQRRWDEAIAGLDEAAEELSSEFRWAFLLAAGVVESAVRAAAPAGFAFDLTNWRVLAIFQGMERDLVNLFRTDNRQVIIDLVARGGLTARALVESLGLSRVDAVALARYRDSLIDDPRTLGRRQQRTNTKRPPLSAEARSRMTVARLTALRLSQVGRVGLWQSQLAIQTAIDAVLHQAIEFGAVQRGAVQRTWWTMEDEKVRGSHKPMHGQVRPLDTPFVSGAGNLLMYPMDPRAPASETRECRCGLTVSF
jgi:hypothetical protein